MAQLVIFFKELWQDYRQLFKLLVGTALELVVILLTLRGEQWFVAQLGILERQPAHCGVSNWYECIHSVVVALALLVLLGSLLVVSAVFIYRRSLQHIKEMSIEAVKEYSEALVSALTSLDPNATDQDRARAIEMLLPIRRDRPLDRRVNLLLGRLYKARGDYDGAIDAVTWVLEKKRAAKETTDKDYADLLYNRACYLVLRASKTPKAEIANQFGNRAYQDLELSIALSPENANDARNDPDFASIRDEERFKGLTGG